MTKLRNDTNNMSTGMVDLLLNILENPKGAKEDKQLARGELRRMALDSIEGNSQLSLADQAK